MIPRLLFVERDERGIRLCPTAPSRSVLCLGNFDGVHIAHTALLQAGLRLARERNAGATAAAVLPHLRCGAFSFFSPSSDFVRECRHPSHLTVLKEKLRLLLDGGADFVCLCRFPDIRDMTPQAFMDLLRESCGCEAVVCGYNYRFGAKGVGTPADLTAVFGETNTVILPRTAVKDITVSSTRIRELLAAGDAETAAELLGRPYAIETTVVHGKRLGRQWGFPTANQYFLSESLIPAYGVYAVLCHTPFGTFPGVSNVGIRPTVDHRGRVNCETYVIGFAGDLYGQRMRVEFLKHLRGEKRFSDVSELITAIRQDAAEAQAYVRARYPHRIL